MISEQNFMRETPVVNFVKLLFLRYYAWKKTAEVVVPEESFQPSVIFPSKTWTLSLECSMASRVGSGKAWK